MPLTDAKLRRVLKSKPTPFKITDAEGLYVLVAARGSEVLLKPAKAVKHRTAHPAGELPAFVDALNIHGGDLITKLAMKLRSKGLAAGLH
jgi:hypothetical protein